jgi:hypothetical protein
MAESQPILTWNPVKGYSCSACDWMRRVHIGPQLPPDDDNTAIVRRAFAKHLRECHRDKDHLSFLASAVRPEFN